ncbi:hypothetical protein QF037_008630 [Streptomyces canus]|uniref:hypothetical protein n=1 Tax=Streptomyces canus TaxID=58343 RepID=UPI00278AD02A|nr:hypothetical protein [Streptomyces canus]MDQ0604285.1 hypothetical protein [Streptomyces canus]
MQTVQVVPGLIVDEELFDATVHGLEQYAPSESLTWEDFTSEDRWLLVPDPDGLGYKAELVLRREEDRTVKVNLWMAPDLRDGAKPQPHNHPWEFTAHILAGGYTEQRYELVDGQVVTETRVHEAGGTNHMPLSSFHEVTHIQVPGRTLTLMVCGAGRQGAWEYLDPDTGEVEPNRPDPGFREGLAALNPRMR